MVEFMAVGLKTWRRSPPTLGSRMRTVGMVLTISSVILSSPIAARASDHPVERHFDDARWAEGLNDVRPSDLRNSTTVEPGFDGLGLEVNIPRGQHRGLGSYQRLQDQPDEAWYRYHIQLLSFDSRSSGKLPGLSGLYSRSGKGCAPSKPSSPGWSARGMFGAAGMRGAPGGEVPIGVYLYHLDQPRDCGEAFWWENSSLKPGHWHCIEGHVKLNTPGFRDGLVEGWLDGTRRFARGGLAFRRANEPTVGIREMWLDVYFGGRKPTPNSLRLVIDDVVVSTASRVGCVDSSTNLVGSFEGEVTAIATYRPDTGSWLMNRGGGESFLGAETWASYVTTTEWTTHVAGDFNGDRKDDIASYHPSNGTWWVSRSTGRGFSTKQWEIFGSKTGWGRHLVSDFTGDSRDDIASYNVSNGTWWISNVELVQTDLRPEQMRRLEDLLDDTDSQALDPIRLRRPLPAERFVTRLWDSFTTRTGWSSQVVGDFDGDGLADIASYHPGTGTWWVSLSTGDGFTTRRWGTYSTKTGWTSQVAGDFNGDGRDDIASYHPGAGAWWVSLSTGEGFTPVLWDAFSTKSGWSRQVVGDFDGNGLDDIASYHPRAGTWWVSLSTGDGFTTRLWSTYSTKTGWTSQVAGDFNADGRDDIANYHTTTDTWWVSTSTETSFLTTRWTPPDSH